MSRAIATAALALVLGTATITAAADVPRPFIRPLGLITSHLEEGPLAEPRGVALDLTREEVWVVDTRGGRLGVFTSDGVPIFATSPSDRLREPHRVAVDSAGRLLVLDNDRTAINVLDYRGEWIGTLDLPGLPAEPSIGAIAVDRSGRLYVGENGEGRVHVFSPELKTLARFGSRGTEEGQFQSIAGIAADDEAIFVVDHQVTPVQVFDRRGTFLRGWGRHDMGAQNFSLPQAVALDSKGHVVVVDALRHEIKFFDREGRFLDRFGGYGGRPGNVAFPADVAIDGADRLYVAERGNGRVQVFEIVDAPAPGRQR